MQQKRHINTFLGTDIITNYKKRKRKDVYLYHFYYYFGWMYCIILAEEILVRLVDNNHLLRKHSSVRFYFWFFWLVFLFSFSMYWLIGTTAFVCWEIRIRSDRIEEITNCTWLWMMMMIIIVEEILIQILNYFCKIWWQINDDINLCVWQ